MDKETIDTLKNGGDVVNLSVIWTWLLGVLPTLPEIAAIVSIIYTLLRIYDWFKGRK